MGRNRSKISNEESLSQTAADGEKQNVSGRALGWWYQHFAPPEPPIASPAHRERVQRGKLASIAVLILILSVLAMLPQAVISKNLVQIPGICVGTAASFVVLFLNRRGFIRVAGVLVLVLLYSGQAFNVLTHPGGLTESSIVFLDFSVLPEVLVLAFFSANSLLPVVCINILATWTLVVYGPHDATITYLLHHAPLQIFAPVYTLQLTTAAAMYLWAYSVKLALKRADRAEEIAAFEKREKERRQRELEQKRELDAGVQQLLQTLVAAANGDLSARAPLSQDHVLWQVAMSLNNLIARLQSMSHTESELRQQIWEGNERVTGAQRALRPEVGGTTGAQKALRATGRVTEAQKALRSETGNTVGAQKARRSKTGITGQLLRIKQSEAARSGSGNTAGRLKALRLKQEDRADQEKIPDPGPASTTEAQKVAHPEISDTGDEGA